MPTYVYECPQCKKQKEVVCSIKELDSQHIVCSCINKGPHLWEGDLFHVSMKRIIAPTSFILKGPGWAKDGYSNGK